MNNTMISWTNHTWNFLSGCSKISDGCKNCYAERIALKFKITPKPWTVGNAAENIQFKPHKLREPYKLKEPSRIFVNSMSDCFHELVQREWQEKAFAVMRDLPQHTFQILTKRPALAAQWPASEWSPNIWMGTSVEDARVIRRIDDLRHCPAHVRFISAEPLIGPWPDKVDLTGIDWVIVGGESGPGHRKMPHAWARHIRDLCLDQGVAFFFKQSAAYRTELGTSLRHADGTFWTWQQWPDQMDDPVLSEPHKYACE